MIVLDIDGVIANIEDIEESTLDILSIKNAKPYEDAWYWVNHYSSMYDIMFITSRTKKLNTPTWEWFREWDIPVDFVVFEEDKIDFLQQINPTVYVDDDVYNVSNAIDAGITAFVIDREYNRVSGSDHINRIISLWDIKCV